MILSTDFSIHTLDYLLGLKGLHDRYQFNPGITKPKALGSLLLVLKLIQISFYFLNPTGLLGQKY